MKRHVIRARNKSHNKLNKYLFQPNMNRLSYTRLQTQHKQTNCERANISQNVRVSLIFVNFFCGFSNPLPHCPSLHRCYDSFQQIQFVQSFILCFVRLKSVFLAQMYCVLVSVCVRKSDVFYLQYSAIREYNNFSVYSCYMGHMYRISAMRDKENERLH